MMSLDHGPAGDGGEAGHVMDPAEGMTLPFGRRQSVMDESDAGSRFFRREQYFELASARRKGR